MSIRTLFLVGICASLAGCNESSFFVKEDLELDGPKPGSVEGRVCDPSGRTWLADAKVYTHLFDPSGHLYETRLVFTDRDGRWILEELPPGATYQIFVQYGDDIIESHDVFVGDEDAVFIDEPDCFDPLTLNVAVVKGDYDDFDLILERMGFANYTLVDGLLESESKDFFGDLETMKQYDLIFVNGGFVEEGVVFSSDGTHETYLQNIRDYVSGGGAVYASDWAYDVVELGWPDRVDFAGDDTVVDDAQGGEYDLVVVCETLHWKGDLPDDEDTIAQQMREKLEKVANVSAPAPAASAPSPLHAPEERTAAEMTSRRRGSGRATRATGPCAGSGTARRSASTVAAIDATCACP